MHTLHPWSGSFTPSSLLLLQRHFIEHGGSNHLHRGHGHHQAPRPVAMAVPAAAHPAVERPGAVRPRWRCCNAPVAMCPGGGTPCGSVAASAMSGRHAPHLRLAVPPRLSAHLSFCFPSTPFPTPSKSRGSTGWAPWLRREHAQLHGGAAAELTELHGDARGSRPGGAAAQHGKLPSRDRRGRRSRRGLLSR
jgi:hypothetical protein